MKNRILFFCLLLSLVGAAQEGYEIKVTFTPYRNQYIYLGHYFGKTYPIIDSVKLDANSTGIFKGNKSLQGGIYLIGYPNRSGFFEILIDKQQRFTVLADSATVPGVVRFQNSPDNELFSTYQRTMGEKGAQINTLREQLKNVAIADSLRINKELSRLDVDLREYREKVIAENPKAILSALLNAMKEPVLPVALQKPVTREDSVAAFRYYKEHFWDGVDFWDPLCGHCKQNRCAVGFLCNAHKEDPKKQPMYILFSVHRETNSFLLYRGVGFLRQDFQKY